jgi:hypothetical protein
MAASVSPTRGVSFSLDMREMVMTQIYNPEDRVTSVTRFSTFDGKGAREEFKLKSILKISDSPSLIDHEMLELIKKVESAAKIPAHQNFGAKTRNSVESFQATAKGSFKPTLTTLSAFCEEEEEV